MTAKVKTVMESWKVDMQCFKNEQVMVEWSGWDKNIGAVG